MNGIVFFTNYSHGKGNIISHYLIRNIFFSYSFLSYPKFPCKLVREFSVRWHPVADTLYLTGQLLSLPFCLLLHCCFQRWPWHTASSPAWWCYFVTEKFLIPCSFRKKFIIMKTVKRALKGKSFVILTINFFSFCCLCDHGWMNDISRPHEIHLRQIKVLGAISSDISRPRGNNLCLLKALGSAWALHVCFVFFVGVCTLVIWSSELLWTLFMSWFKRTAPTFSHTSRYEITPMCRGEGKSFWNLAHLTSTPVELLFWVQKLCYSYQSSYYFMDWACAL